MCLLKCSILVKVAGYRPATLLNSNFFTGIFQNFDHVISVILCRTANLKNVYLFRTHSSTATSAHSLNSKHFNTVAKSHQRNWRMKRKKTCISIYFCKGRGGYKEGRMGLRGATGTRPSFFRLSKFFF